MKKRFLAFLLTLCLLLSLTPSVYAEGIPFRDVDQNDWFYDEVSYVYANGLMSGSSSTTFEPDSKLTRAELCQILYNLEGKPAASGIGFADVSSRDWYYNAVMWASGEGIVNGTGSGQFSPNLSIPREQMVTIIYRYALYKGLSPTSDYHLAPFVDVRSVSDWAYDGMNWAVGEGIIGGVTQNTIAPQDTANRAQAATILMRFHQKLNVDELFESKDIDDFEGQTVINFDESDETNFGVLPEDVVETTGGGARNHLASIDDETGVITIIGIDNTIKSLKPGDIFYYTEGEETLLIKVGEIEFYGTTAYITEGEATLSELFDYIDIDMSVGISEEHFDASGMSEAVELLNVQQVPDEDALLTQGKLDGSLDTVFTFGVKKDWISITANNKMTFNLVIKWDKWLFDVEEIKVSVEQETSVEGSLFKQVAGTQEPIKEYLGTATIPIGTTGAEAVVEVYYFFELKAGVEGKFETKLTSENGILYKNGKSKEINESDVELGADITGKLKIETGMGVDINAQILKIVKLTMALEGGLNVDAVAETPLSVEMNPEEKHNCVLCVDGDVVLFADLSFKVKVGVTKKNSYTLVDVTLGRGEVELGEFYISYRMSGANDLVEFNWGSCPYKQVRLDIRVVDEIDNPVWPSAWEVTGPDGYIVDCGTMEDGSTATTYCSEGTHKVFIHGAYGYFNKSEVVTIAGEPAVITVKLERDPSVKLPEGEGGPGPDEGVDPDQLVYVNNYEELVAAIGSDKYICMNPGNYNTDEPIYISNVENLIIDGSASDGIISQFWDDTVIDLYNCSNVTLYGLYLGHDESFAGGCTAGVVSLYECSDIKIDDCEIFGCGITGLAVTYGGVVVKNSIIRDCDINIADISGDVLFENCAFYGNGKGGYEGWQPPAFYFYDGSLELVNCDFHDNDNGTFIKTYDYIDGATHNFSERGCTYRNNNWQ